MQAILLVLLLLSSQTMQRTAREYFDEIYDIGRLDQIAAGEVCFDEDPAHEDFFIFEQSKYLRQYMAMRGTFQNLPKEMQQRLKNDLLVVRGYHKGIVSNGEDFYVEDGNSWISDVYELDEENSMRIRLTINWQTHRYKRAVELLDHEMHFQREISRLGHCEDVSTEVPQTASPD